MSWDFASVDVSFISLKLIPACGAPRLKRGTAMSPASSSPQFEAGREKVGKKGVVRDPAVHLEVLEHFLEHAKESRFTVLGLTYSPIRGPEGNIEYLGYLSRAIGRSRRSMTSRALSSVTRGARPKKAGAGC